ncbi:MAG: DUF4136 domain-containing protein [Acidobacteriota bacterium]
MMVRSRLLPLLLTPLLIVLAVPAEATKVNVKYAAADYDEWTTWAFIENTERDAAAAAAGQAELRALVHAAITERLEAAGFVHAGEGDEPDFLVAMDGSMREVFDVRDYHQQISDHVALVMEGGTTSYREGTLMIRILDGEKVVWTGWITEEVKDPDKPAKQIRKAVKKILRKFPPRDRR